MELFGRVIQTAICDETWKFCVDDNEEIVFYEL
jgi:hypothetical protein